MEKSEIIISLNNKIYELKKLNSKEKFILKFINLLRILRSKIKKVELLESIEYIDDNKDRLFNIKSKDEDLRFNLITYFYEIYEKINKSIKRKKKKFFDKKYIKSLLKHIIYISGIYNKKNPKTDFIKVLLIKISNILEDYLNDFKRINLEDLKNLIFSFINLCYNKKINNIKNLRVFNNRLMNVYELISNIKN